MMSSPLFRGLGLRRPRTSASLVLCFVLGGAACGFGCSSSTSEVATSGGDASADATPTGDAGTDAPADASVAGSADRIGAVFAISDGTAADGGTKSASRAGASFTHVTTPDGTTQSKTVGPCLVEIIGDGTAAVEEDLSAGIVHIEGGSKNLDLTPMADKTYAPLTASTLLFGGGETLTARADGKDVPPFTTTLTAPSKITLAAPTVTAGALTVTRSTGVSATFSGASSGSVVLYFSSATATKAYAATCTFPAASGAGVVPAAAFADFPAGDGTFDFYVKESSVAAVTGWQVHFTASKAVVDPAGEALAGQATFQ
jgi:hypothetical protein